MIPAFCSKISKADPERNIGSHTDYNHWREKRARKCALSSVLVPAYIGLTHQIQLVTQRRELEHLCLHCELVTPERSSSMRVLYMGDLS